ncbi:MAG: glycosyltransferase [Candidatus Micrarchaeaceae archaeon]
MKHIYATLYNNEGTIERTMNSLLPLMPFDLYVVDNFSTDNSVAKLHIFCLRHDLRATILQKKTTRGEGRRLACEMMLREGKTNPHDLTFFIDFDEIYRASFINYIKKAEKTYTYKQLCINKGVCRVKTNALLPWLDLNQAEDIFRVAKARSLGLDITIPKKRQMGYTNIPGKGEKRYANGLKLAYRLFNNAVDFFRGSCVSPDDFADIIGASVVEYPLINLCYLTARIKGLMWIKKGVSNWEYSSFVKIVKKRKR